MTSEVESFVRTCENCRNKNTALCRKPKYFRRHYKNKLKKQKGYGNDPRFSHPKKYCKFWAYDPNQNGIWKTHP